MFCTKCGNQLNDAAVICPKCGCPTANFKAAQPQAQQTVTVDVSSAKGVSNTAAATPMEWKKPLGIFLLLLGIYMCVSGLSDIDFLVAGLGIPVIAVGSCFAGLGNLRKSRIAGVQSGHKKASPLSRRRIFFNFLPIRYEWYTVDNYGKIVYTANREYFSGDDLP